MRGLKTEAIITAGAEGCRHYEGITAEVAYSGHLIGRCRYCPRVVDYTVAQATPLELQELRRKKSRRGQARATENRRKERADAVLSD